MSAEAHRFDPTILREYDVRGIVGQTLHAADARARAAFESLIASAKGKETPVRIPFDHTLKDAHDAHITLVKLSKAAKQK